MKNKKALVTGCAGFIGSHMCDFLINNNYELIGIDNLSTGQKNFMSTLKNNSKFTFINEDLTNYHAIQSF